MFFPYPTKFREHQTGTGAETEFTKFEYTNVPNAVPTNVTVFAKVKSELSDREPVVRFVDRYGVEARELLVKEKMMSRLLYCGTLNGEHDAGSAEDRDAWPEDARKQVKRAINTLHRSGLMFGDPRPPNVLFSGGKVFLIALTGQARSTKRDTPMTPQHVWIDQQRQCC